MICFISQALFNILAADSPVAMQQVEIWQLYKRLLRDTRIKQRNLVFKFHG